LFSDNMNTLEFIIDSYVDKSNLSADIDFDYVVRHLPAKTNVFIFLDMVQTIQTLKLNLSCSAIRSVNNWEPYLTKFNSMGLSLNNRDDGIETFIFLKLKQKMKIPITLRWKLDTKGTIIASP